ncbi:MAG: MFS transporter [Candidatus Moranbacteria bacterium]|jgi:MFS family permease|nr:MFS transporter [Candidatus Moranbacteria bacterium]
MEKINQFKHIEKKDNKKLFFIDVVSFLMGFAAALFAYIISSYFKEVLGTDNVGVVYFIAYVIVLILLLNMHKLVYVFGKSFILHIALLLKIVAVFGLLMVPISYLGIGFLILYTIAGTLSWSVLSLIMESFSVDNESGRIRGAHLSISNAGFLLGPLLSAQLLEKYNFEGVFFVSLIVYIFIFIFSLVYIRRTNHRFKQKVKVAELLKKVFKRKNIMKIYYVSFVLEFFYALMVIYVPIYMLERGFTWDQLGVAFTIMLIPFVFVQYPAGLIADKKTGEKEILLFSFFILGISTLLFYFADSGDIIVWTTILLLGRIGAALIEILRESYFFKRIDGNDVDIVDFFGTSKPVAYIVATACSSVLLIFSSISSIFILVAIVCFSAIYPVFKLADNKSERDVKRECLES